MSAQEEFDKKYISSSEVCQRLGIHRTSVMAAQRSGRLPPGVRINRPNGQPQIILWERSEIAVILDEWAAYRAQRASA